MLSPLPVRRGRCCRESIPWSALPTRFSAIRCGDSRRRSATKLLIMGKKQEPVYGKGHFHLITCVCYQKQEKLGLEKHRNVFARLLEELRVKFRFGIVGYVVMPDHFRLLMSEPKVDT